MNLINRIICGDNLQVLREFEDNYFDLTVTSPPYDQIRSYKNKAGFNWNFETFCELAEELYRVIKEGGCVVWVVGDQTISGSETGSSFKQALHFKEVGFRLHDTMIFEKAGPTYPAHDGSSRYSSIFEYMFVLSKGAPKTHNLIKDKKNKWAGVENWGRATARQVDGSLKEGRKHTINEYGYRNNIWRISSGFGNATRDKIAYNHPAIFPEELARDHILTWSNPGDFILEPFNGSGTTGVQSYELGRNFIGIDVAEEYCDLYKERMKIRFDLDLEIERYGLPEQIK